MAIVLIEGFDHLTAAQLASKGWTLGSNVFVSGGRSGGQSYGTNQSNPTATTKSLPSSYSTLIAGFAFQTNFTPATVRPFFRFRAGGTDAVQVVLNTNDKLQIKNSAGTVIANGVTTLALNTWYYIEVKAVINGTSGSITVQLNGTAGEIAATTGNFGSTNLDSIVLGSSDNLGPGTFWYFDDMYVLDTSGTAPRNTFLGDVKVETMYPSADGANTAWTPSSGAAHNAVDETAGHNSDTDYITSSTPGDRSTFAIPAIGTLTGTIFGVQVNNTARKDDIGARTIAPVIRQAGTNYDGTTTGGLTTSYVTYSQIYNQDPTGSDWTVATVNGDEYGVKEVS